MGAEANILHNISRSPGAVDVAASVCIVEEYTGHRPLQPNHSKCLTSKPTKNYESNLLATTPFWAVVKQSQNFGNCWKKSRANQPIKITSPAFTVTDNEGSDSAWRKSYPNAQMARKPNNQPETMSRIIPHEPYESEGLQPQEIRNDFAELMLMSDPEILLRSLSATLSTDDLARFIDNHMMGRV